MEPILVVMAAGMGSRYGGNKQIDPVDAEGDIIMDFSLHDAWKAGFTKAVFIIKKDFEKEFKAHTEKRAGSKMECRYVFQELNDIPEGFAVPDGRTKPWGTGHAVLAARDYLDAPFAVINADDFYGAEAFRLIYDFLKEKADATHHCMVGFKVENTLSENGTVSRGICRENNGLLTDIEEHLEVGRESSGPDEGKITGIDTHQHKNIIPDGTPVSMNLWGFGAEYVDVLKKDFEDSLGEIIKENPMKGEFYLPSSIDGQIKSDKATVEVLRSGDKWFGVTYKEDKPLVEKIIKEMKDSGKYPTNLWK